MILCLPEGSFPLLEVGQDWPTFLEKMNQIYVGKVILWNQYPKTKWTKDGGQKFNLFLKLANGCVTITFLSLFLWAGDQLFIL